MLDALCISYMYSYIGYDSCNHLHLDYAMHASHGALSHQLSSIAPVSVPSGWRRCHSHAMAELYPSMSLNGLLKSGGVPVNQSAACAPEHITPEVCCTGDMPLETVWLLGVGKRLLMRTGFSSHGSAAAFPWELGLSSDQVTAKVGILSKRRSQKGSKEVSVSFH